jgi:hypothetical protein
MALCFERTFDYELVRRIITHPKIYRWMVSDGAVPAEEYQAVEDVAICYLLCQDGKEILGLFILIPQTSACIQVHACFSISSQLSTSVERDDLEFSFLASLRVNRG